MPDEERCTRTDLPRSGCAHCRGHLDPLAGRIEISDRRVTARFDGRCAVCRGPITPGDTIAPLTDHDGYACTRCLP